MTKRTSIFIALAAAAAVACGCESPGATSGTSTGGTTGTGGEAASGGGGSGQGGTAGGGSGQGGGGGAGGEPMEAGHEPPPELLVADDEPGVFPDDPSKDSTAGLQNALQKAYEAKKVLFLSRNARYYVSGTLAGVQPPSNCDDASGSSFRIIGSGRGANRPTLVLLDGSAGFGSAANPRSLIQIGKDDDGDGAIDGGGCSCAFRHVVKDVNLELGDNPGAVGIEMPGAQRGALEDVRVDATGAFAGVIGVPGRSTSVGNIEVVGGQYGIDLTRTVCPAVGISLYGITLTGQTKAGLVENAIRVFTMVGFDIAPAGGVAFQTAGTSEQAGHAGLYDGKISLAAPGTAISNTAKRGLELRNVYFQNAETLLDNGSEGKVGGSADGWTRADTHTYCPTAAVGAATCWNLIDGVKTKDPGSSIQLDSGAPPQDLVSRHVWTATPELLGPKVLFVTDAPYGAKPDDDADDREAIQAAIDSTEPGQPNAGKHVFVPQGTYELSGPVTLRASTHLFALPGGQTYFHARDAWVDSLSGPAWVFETEDDAAAETSIEYVWTTWKEYAEPSPWIGTARWRAGRHSVMRGVRGEKVPGRCEDKPRQMWRVEGNGGGRFYTWMEEPSVAAKCETAAEMDPAFRKLYVTGTTEPLTIYGPNPEHGGKHTPGPANLFIELVQCANVRMFGMKVESNGTTIRIDQCQNVLIAGSHDFSFDSADLPYIEVNDSSDLEMSMIAAWGGSPAELVAETNMSPPSAVVTHASLLGLYRRGALDWSAW